MSDKRPAEDPDHDLAARCEQLEGTQVGPNGTIEVGPGRAGGIKRRQVKGKASVQGASRGIAGYNCACSALGMKGNECRTSRAITGNFLIQA